MDPSPSPNESNTARLPNPAFVWERSTRQMKDVPVNLRPRELAERVGIDKVRDEDLLAMLLGSGTRGHNVMDVAHGLLAQYGSLGGLARADTTSLRRVPGIGKVKALTLCAVLEIGRRIGRENGGEPVRVRSPEDVARCLRSEVLGLEREHFWVLLLNRKNQLKAAPRAVTVGVLDASLVDARTVFEDAIRHQAHALVLAHNHPSGDPAPSGEDLQITRKLVDAGRLLGIPVLDHVVLGRPGPTTPGYLSLRESGLVAFE